MVQHISAAKVRPNAAISVADGVATSSVRFLGTAWRFWLLLSLSIFLCGSASAKVISALPGEPTFALGVWYVYNCNQSAGLGSLSVTIQPIHGSVNISTSSAPPPGCPAGSSSLPYALAQYTLDNTTPPSTADYFQVQYILNGQSYTPVDIYVVNGNYVGKLEGQGHTPNPSHVGEPVDVASGNMFYSVTDYTTAGQNPLAFTRSYNSLSSLATQLPVLYTTSQERPEAAQEPLVAPSSTLAQEPHLALSSTAAPAPQVALSSTLAQELGMNWRSNYDRYLRIPSSGQVIAERPDGQQIIFHGSGSTWTPDTDVNLKLTHSGNTWELTDGNDTVETYTAINILPEITATSISAQLNSIRLRNGYTQTLTYSGGYLSNVTDSYNRSLEFTYSAGLMESVTTPDGLVVKFGYTVSGSQNQLTSASYSTTPETTQKYLYEDASYPSAMTGILDENGNRYATWSYDAAERCVGSQLGTGANTTTILYNSNGSRVVTNALGAVETYKFTTLQNIPKVQQIARAASSGVTAATESFTYDSNGYLASQTDWNGNKTTFVNSSQGFPTTINEAVGTAQARTTTIAYSSRYPDLPTSVATPGLTTALTYDSQGNLAIRTLTDATSQTLPYSTHGQYRKWTYTWANSLLASVSTPKGETTKFTYGSTGALTQIVNPLNQATNITNNSPGGYPRVSVDPNGVTTTLVYNPRQNLTRSSVTTKAGAITTQFIRDNAQNLTGVTLPDGSELTYEYDAAHRLTGVTDKLGNHIAYTLDGLGDRTATAISSSGASTPQGEHSATFDDLGRLATDVGGAGQTTSYSYDRNGNPLTIVDALKHPATQLFDALNRIAKVTDANKGITSFTYDAHDRPTTVTDANGNATNFVYDGFGEVLQQVSPDSGTTVYHYDADGNLTQKVDALKVTTNFTYDALARPLTTAYPASAALNVTYVYDQTGHGFGIGRLTGVTDAAGTLSRSYDERGNLLNETRVKGSSTLSTTYTYDAASRIASMTYPDGMLVRYSRDAAGQLSKATATIGTSTKTVVSGATHLPFGPLSGMTYGNGIAETWTYDTDYRATNIADVLATKSVQSLAYGYDNDNNVTAITDAVNPANSQSMVYDVINRLTGAASGTGGYGSYKWTYDKVGNRLTQTLGTATTMYSYASGSNRLAMVGTVPVVTNANGNITSIPPANSSASATFAYSAANRLASVTGSPTAASFIYDWAGQRYSKTDSGSTPTLYSYMQGGALMEENNGGQITDYIYADGRPVANVQPGAAAANQLNFVLADRLGTPQLAINGAGATVWQTTYQPFGTTGNVATSIIQNLRFPGQNADVETGFSYNMNRDYMPNLGRYLESDPIGLIGGTNTYGYVAGNPTKWRDPSGELFCPWCGAIGAVIGGVSAGYGLHANNPNAGFFDYVEAVGSGAFVGGAVGTFAPESWLASTLLGAASGGLGDVVGQLVGAHSQGLGWFCFSEIKPWEVLEQTAIGGATAGIGTGIAKLGGSVLEDFNVGADFVDAFRDRTGALISGALAFGFNLSLPDSLGGYGLAQ